MNVQSIKRLLAATALTVALPAAAGAQDIQAEVISLPEWSYDELYTDGISVEELLDAFVQGPTGEDIGDVENVVSGRTARCCRLSPRSVDLLRSATPTSAFLGLASRSTRRVMTLPSR